MMPTAAAARAGETTHHQPIWIYQGSELGDAFAKLLRPKEIAAVAQTSLQHA
jgi:hypothetical protein